MLIKICFCTAFVCISTCIERCKILSVGILSAYLSISLLYYATSQLQRCHQCHNIFQYYAASHMITSAVLLLLGKVTMRYTWLPVLTTGISHRHLYVHWTDLSSLIHCAWDSCIVCLLRKEVCCLTIDLLDYVTRIVNFSVSLCVVHVKLRA